MFTRVKDPAATLFIQESGNGSRKDKSSGWYESSGIFSLVLGQCLEFCTVL